jgi:pimeloyl-ACP methyl ester carboxylesterase
MFKPIVQGIAAALALAAQPPAAEEVTRLTGTRGEPALLVRHAPADGPSVLYIHGATFPSGLSVAYRIDGRSWMDDLHERGFDVWAFDFAGFGGSDRPAAPYRGDAEDSVREIERVVRHILRQSGRKRLALIAHSRGSLPAGMFAARHPELVERLVLFGPVALRHGPAEPVPANPTLPVTVEDQSNSFRSGVPDRESVIAPERFEAWARDYLASDPASGSRTPPAVLVPSGPQRDLAAAWAGGYPYDPAAIRAPTLIVRGEWDSITTDADAAWLVARLSGVPGGARDVKLPRGAHRMHLETNRQALFDAVGAFLADLRPADRTATTPRGTPPHR